MNVVVLKSKLDALANAIGIKAGKRVPQTLDELVETVEGIQTGIEPTGTIAITSNGEHDVAGYALADVAVPSGSANLQAKTRTITAAGTFTDTPDAGYDGLSSVQTTVPAVNPVVDQYGTFKTVSGQRKWDSFAYADADGAAGWFVDDGNHTNTKTYNAIAANTSVTPTESSQTIGGSNYMMEGAVTVNAISSSYVGSGITRRDSTSLSASGATVSVPAGYYASSASKAVASGSVTASATKGSVSNHSVQVTPSASVTAGYISSGATGTAVTVQASELVSGSETKTVNGTYDVTNLAEIVVDVSGGGGTGLQVAYADTALSAAASSIQFTGLDAEPTSFVVFCWPPSDTISTGSPARVAAVVFDGQSLHGQTVTTTSNANASYDTGFSKSYSNGTLTITATTAQFIAAEYGISYTYGGGSIETADVQVGSGATSISFTGLEDEPVMWSCIFKSNFGTSSGYQRVMAVQASEGGDPNGFCLDSSAHYSDTYWTASYSNGTLTITSSGTNAGGYWHQPGYYQLTYALDTSGNYQSKTVTPTTSQQVVTADSQYDALKKVTVNAIPDTYVQQTATQGAPTYTPTTTAQTIATGTYLTGTQTIQGDANLVAGNIKSGTTIFGVTGTYSGGGGGSATVDTKTVTASNRPSTLSFTSMKGEPIMFALKATFTMTSSSSTYYYVDSMRGYLSNGSYSVQGRLFRMGSTRQTEQVQTGYSATYSGGTLTLTSTGNRTTSPGCFYNGSYELVYVY